MATVLTLAMLVGCGGKDASGSTGNDGNGGAGGVEDEFARCRSNG